MPIDSRKFLALGWQYSWVLVCRQESNMCFPQSNILLHIAPSHKVSHVQELLELHCDADVLPGHMVDARVLVQMRVGVGERL